MGEDWPAPKAVFAQHILDHFGMLSDDQDSAVANQFIVGGRRESRIARTGHADKSGEQGQHMAQYFHVRGYSLEEWDMFAVIMLSTT